jgi:hypothetical protein
MRAQNIVIILFAFSAVILLLSGCGMGQLSATCVSTLSTSPEAPDHAHNWCVGVEYTKNYCDAQGECHKHKINEVENIAEPAGIGPHTHALR